MRKYLKNPWAINIGGFIIGALALRLIDWLFINDALWSWIKGVFNAIGDYFNTEHSIKFYMLVLLFVMIVAATIAILYLMSPKRGNNVEMFEYPEWVNYTRDVFDGVQYRWKYTFRGMNSEIYDITPYCNKCSCVIVGDICPNCKTDYNWHWNTPNIKQEGEVQALIVHRIESGLYKNSPYFKT